MILETEDFTASVSACPSGGHVEQTLGETSVVVHQR